MAIHRELPTYKRPTTGPPVYGYDDYLTVNQTPGDFTFFWNIVVPLSVLLNICHFGLRLHEVGLLIALLLSPYFIHYILEHHVLSWVVLIFLLIWVERILRRWPCYKIYNVCFLSKLVLLLGFFIIPTILLRLVWHPLYSYMAVVLEDLLPGTRWSTIHNYRDILMLVIAVLILLHAVYTYRTNNGCIDPSSLCLWFSTKKKCPPKKCKPCVRRKKCD